MTTAAGSSAEIEAYLAAVRAALSDLPEDERADLLAEVEASLVDAVGEGDQPIASLGPPEAFAAELRSSAGLGDPVVLSARGGDLAALRALAVRFANRPAVHRIVRSARELAPAWWLVRGVLLVAAVAAATGASRSIAHPWLPHLPSARATAFWVVIAVVASFAIGLRTRGTAAAAVVIAVLALDVVALLAVVPVERNFRDAPSAYALGVPAVEFVQAAPSPGLLLNGGRVTNIYPYSRSGTLLHDVLLYDQAGNPISLGLGPDPLRRLTRGVNDQVIANTFPIRYFAPNTFPRKVSKPDAHPLGLRPPTIVTPALAP
jgi:hypothetical protein